MLQMLVRLGGAAMARVPPARSMATLLKDYTSLYDTLEIHPEATKTEIRSVVRQ